MNVREPATVNFSSRGDPQAAHDAGETANKLVQACSNRQPESS